MREDVEIVELTYAEGFGYCARHVPSNVASQGDTREDALRALVEALKLHQRSDSEAVEASDEWFERFGVSQ
ncbi:type II toxin-antitoxin system HicB family antitoxin [Halogeometricum salsisoli]|uniref:type II toxin-antitoxin system HicB family antitoxin n=1 Tax=Halogeometricum salsisoli TaxID=2950536 RepID=UPI003CCD80A5